MGVSGDWGREDSCSHSQWIDIDTFRALFFPPPGRFRYPSLLPLSFAQTDELLRVSKEKRRSETLQLPYFPHISLLSRDSLEELRRECGGVKARLQLRGIGRAAKQQRRECVCSKLLVQPLSKKMADCVFLDSSSHPSYCAGCVISITALSQDGIGVLSLS